MPSLADTIEGRRIEAHRPRPRIVVNAAGWSAAANRMAAGEWTLLGLWGAIACVHMAVMGEGAEIAVLTLECADGEYPSVGAVHPPAIRFERAIRDLYGLIPLGLPDTRPWLDLGFWEVTHPLAVQPGAAVAPTPFPFLPSEGGGLHQVPVGPVHAGIIEPGHFRFTANGERIVRLEQRLGYVHKGIEHLMTGASLDKAAQLAGRASGDSTVAYALAFAHAVEAALELTVPPRAILLRALMAELERIANHFGDFGAICNDASFAVMHAQCGILREQTLRTADACFGHRLMMDRIVPGGVARDIATRGLDQVRMLIGEARARFPHLVELYDKTASLQDRTVGTGILHPELARQFGAGGYVGRASGRAFDARKAPGYAPYGWLSFYVSTLEAGDVNARVLIRIREIEQSLAMIEQILHELPHGPVAATFYPEARSGEGLGLVEGFRGDVFAWIAIEAGTVTRCHLRDPSWFQWPLLEAVIEDNIVADFPLCNKSFNCSYSGHDL